MAFESLPNEVIAHVMSYFWGNYSMDLFGQNSRLRSIVAQSTYWLLGLAEDLDVLLELSVIPVLVATHMGSISLKWRDVSKLKIQLLCVHPSRDIYALHIPHERLMIVGHAVLTSEVILYYLIQEKLKVRINGSMTFAVNECLTVSLIKIIREVMPHSYIIEASNKLVVTEFSLRSKVKLPIKISKNNQDLTDSFMCAYSAQEQSFNSLIANKHSIYIESLETMQYYVIPHSQHCIANRVYLTSSVTECPVASHVICYNRVLPNAPLMKHLEVDWLPRSEIKEYFEAYSSLETITMHKSKFTRNEILLER